MHECARKVTNPLTWPRLVGTADQSSVVPLLVRAPAVHATRPACHTDVGSQCYTHALALYQKMSRLEEAHLTNVSGYIKTKQRGVIFGATPGVNINPLTIINIVATAVKCSRVQAFNTNSSWSSFLVYSCCSYSSVNGFAFFLARHRLELSLLELCCRCACLQICSRVSFFVSGFCRKIFDDLCIKDFLTRFTFCSKEGRVADGTHTAHYS
jgi:hypothetical protein